MTDHIPSRTCYQHGCPRPECKQADYQYMSRLRLDYQRGRRRRTDAIQVRHHIERLRAAGWTQAQIARAAGLAHRTIGCVAAGAPTVSNRTALAVLSVPIGPAPTDTRDVDATGTMRRIRALVAIGWPIAHLAPRFRMYETALGNIARGQLTHVRATTADIVALEYRTLSRIPGPSQRARNEARKKGWHGPAAWDDIDNPGEQPDVEPAAEPEPSRDELAAIRRVEITHLLAFNLSHEEIAARLDMNPGYVRDIARSIRTHLERAA